MGLQVVIPQKKATKKTNCLSLTNFRDGFRIRNPVLRIRSLHAETKYIGKVGAGVDEVRTERSMSLREIRVIRTIRCYLSGS